MPLLDGANHTLVLSKLTEGGTAGFMTFVNGRVVDYVAPT